MLNAIECAMASNVPTHMFNAIERVMVKISIAFWKDFPEHCYLRLTPALVR
jgi:hypothetical protein